MEERRGVDDPRMLSLAINLLLDTVAFFVVFFDFMVVLVGWRRGRLHCQAIRFIDPSVCVNYRVQQTLVEHAYIRFCGVRVN